jgi:SAM-dependent methyltransferase
MKRGSSRLAVRRDGTPPMTRTLSQRIAGRLNEYVLRSRIRAAQLLLGADDFEYWGRYSDAKHGERIDTAFAADLARGEAQLVFLKSVGLRPHHTILDYGCASLGTAHAIIPYLEPGRYVGIDVGKAIAARGVRRLSERGIDRSSYHVLSASSVRLRELDGFRFDVIFEYSVLQYLKRDDFNAVLARFAQLLNPGGAICLSVSTTPLADEDEHRMTRKGMHYHDLDAFRTALPGFDAELAGIDMPVGGRKTMAVFRRAAK